MNCAGFWVTGGSLGIDEIGDVGTSDFGLLEVGTEGREVGMVKQRDRGRGDVGEGSIFERIRTQILGKVR